MPKPKPAPLSVRLPAALTAELEAWATDHGLARNAAVVALITMGLRAGDPAAVPAPEPKPVKAKKASAAATAKAEPIPIAAVSVPVFGTFERKPYQKTGKR